MIYWVQVSIAVLLILVGLQISLFNNYIFIKQLLDKTNTSIVPFVGGVLLSIGLFVLPIQTVSRWYWLPLILDYGCIAYLLFVSTHVMLESRKYAVKNRILTLKYLSDNGTGYFHIYPKNECLHLWEKQDSKGSIVMNVAQYDPEKCLSLTNHSIKIQLLYLNKKWHAQEVIDWDVITHIEVEAST